MSQENAAVPATPIIVHMIGDESIIETTQSSDEAESHLSEAPELIQVERPYNRDDHLEIVPVKKGETRIRLKNPQLREFLFYNTDIGIVSSNVLEQPGDTEIHKSIRQKTAIYGIGQFTHHLSVLKAVTPDETTSINLSFKVFEDFVSIVQEYFDKTSAESLHALEKGLFTFDQLFVALCNTKGLVTFSEDGKTIAGTIKSAQIKSSFFSGPYLAVELKIYTHTGRNIAGSVYSVNIGLFNGEKTSKETGIYILDNHPEIKEQLIARGKRYIELTSKPSYVQTNGVVVRRSYWGPRQFKAKGRVMIDLPGMRRVDPNYSFYFGFDRYADRHDSEDNKVTEITENVLVSLPPYVYGFSFSSKVWGEMDIDEISNISFRTDAYEKLVLDSETKRVIFSLVDTDYSVDADLISGKGGGCIFLLAGNPGLGKTLTAEAISERLHRPLYMVSVGELGTNVETLEESLRQILDTAAAWNAVLLIDEADIFLEQRTPDDIERNAMVGVFLRLLEYYEGILFLTTNRASNIDKAFFSRISVAIHYDDLTEAARKSIWRNLLNNSKTDPALAESLYVNDMNGRQIKNAIRNANALAKAENRIIGLNDFQTVINTTLKFEDHMRAQREAQQAKPEKLGFWARLIKAITNS